MLTEAINGELLRKSKGHQEVPPRQELAVPIRPQAWPDQVESSRTSEWSGVFLPCWTCAAGSSLLVAQKEQSQHLTERDVNIFFSLSNLISKGRLALFSTLHSEQCSFQGIQIGKGAQALKTALKHVGREECVVTNPSPQFWVQWCSHGSRRICESSPSQFHRALKMTNREVFVQWLGGLQPLVASSHPQNPTSTVPRVLHGTGVLENRGPIGAMKTGFLAPGTATVSTLLPPLTFSTDVTSSK